SEPFNIRRRRSPSVMVRSKEPLGSMSRSMPAAERSRTARASRTVDEREMLIVEMSNLAFLSYSPSRDADIHGVDRHLFKHHCTRTHDGVFADRHPRQYVCAGTQKNTAANPGSAADRHPRTDMGEIPDLDLMIDNGAMI